MRKLALLLIINIFFTGCGLVNSGDSNSDNSSASTNTHQHSMIIDHSCTNINTIPHSAIQQAKDTLHIGYGHTSHGSQLTDGMTGLVSFMNAQGNPHDLYSWSQDGAGDSLHLYEGDGYGSGDLDHDAGYYPSWINETNDYLGTVDSQGRGSNHPEINVIMWAWCGQVSGRSAAEIISMYLTPMNQLEQNYPGITFVYMTGHADGTGETGNLHLRNQQIRQYCIDNNKVLYDFYDIECYDPDGTYFGDRNVEDSCGYDGGGNWATEWQSSHTENVDWYNCGAAHSQPLNANQKAYAAWWLFARLAGWDGN